MDDIEDVFAYVSPAAHKSDDVAAVKMKRRVKSDRPTFYGDSFVTGTQSIFVRTWGCAHNTSDSEYMIGLLSAAGYDITTSKEEASIWILNSCTVKTPSEAQLENSIKEAQQLGKYVVVAGCVSQAEPNASFLKGVSIVGVKQIDRIVEVVDETFKGNCVRLLSRNRPDQKLSLPKIRKNNLIEVLAISSGCLNRCTYCKTKMARGNLKSYPIEELIEQARSAFGDGCREVWLTSEDLGAWGRDVGMVLPELLDALVEVIPQGCMMRLGMTNPPYILDYLEDVARILNHPRVYSFLHIPVQSGSDAVLRDMKREYSVDDFRRVVDYMLESVPDIYIATDFICAFPSETAEDFEDSLRLLEKYRFPSVFINQFYPRSGTPAARLKRIDTVEARRRTAAMSAYFRSYSRYGAHRIGEVHDVLVCEVATDKIHFVGHNKCYEQILVPADPAVMGKFVKVRITEVSKFHMKGCFVEDDNFLRKRSKLLVFVSSLRPPTYVLALLSVASMLFLWVLNNFRSF